MAGNEIGRTDREIVLELMAVIKRLRCRLMLTSVALIVSSVMLIVLLAYYWPQ